MRFAIVDNNKVEARSGLIANCLGCSQPVIPKCGDQRVHHWAHSRTKMCDTWWEPETEWHRTWKSKFPEKWQEDFLTDDKTGEKHIADIRTDKGLVIEFQHSHINPEERLSREAFYRNLVWVVDGTRLKRDYPRFLKGRKNCFENQIFYNTDNPKIFRVDLVEWCFPSAWLESSVPVVFDFRGDGSMDDSEGFRNTLYCLFPQVGRYARVAEISRKAFINATTNGEWTLRVQEFINGDIKQDEIDRKEQSLRRSPPSNKVQYTWRGIPIIGGYKEYRRRLSASHNPTRKGRR